MKVENISTKRSYETEKTEGKDFSKKIKIINDDFSELLNLNSDRYLEYVKYIEKVFEFLELTDFDNMSNTPDLAKIWQDEILMLLELEERWGDILEIIEKDMETSNKETSNIIGDC